MTDLELKTALQSEITKHMTPQVAPALDATLQQTQSQIYSIAPQLSAAVPT
jgi:hypothetical protein